MTFLTEIPWWVTAGLILVGVVVLTHGNHRANAGVRTAGLLVIALAFLLGAARFLIDTDAERCERRTRHIVEAANNQDWATLQNLLDPDTHLDLAGHAVNGTGPQEIRKASETVAKQIGLKSVFIITSHTDASAPGLIVVTFSAASLQDVTQDRAFSTGWEFDYRPETGKWDLSSIKMLSMGTEAAQ
jgi:hypothetical protein